MSSMTDTARATILDKIGRAVASTENTLAVNEIKILAEAYAILVGTDVSEKLAEHQSTHCPNCGDHFPSDEVIV